MSGVATQAKLISKVTAHPIWCINPQDDPEAKGYTHFHWIGSLEHSDLQEGEIYEGYLLKLTAIDSFYFIHAGGFVVTPGIDFYSHANIVFDCD